MTGPEHYRASEELLAAAEIAIGQYEENGWRTKYEVASVLTAQAQAHAQLAAIEVANSLASLMPQPQEMAQPQEAVPDAG